MRSLFKDMLGYLPAQVVPAVGGIVFLPVITRLLPPEEYGHYTLVLATVSVLTVITGWLGIAVVRFYPACQDVKILKTLHGTVFVWLGLCVAALAAAFLWVMTSLTQMIPASLFHAMSLGVLLFAVLAISDVLQSLLRVRRLVRCYTVCTIWKSLAGLCLGIWLAVVWHRGIEGLLWGSILAAALAIPFLWVIATRGVRFGLGDFSLSLSKEMARYSFPLVVGNLAGWILSLSDRYVLELFRGSFEVGLYSVSYRVSESSISLLASLFAFAFNPLAVTVWEHQGEDAARGFLEQGTRYFVILCLPAVVGLSVLQRPIVALLAAREYWEGATVLPWVAAGVFFLGLTQRFGAGLNFRKRTTPSMLCILAAAGLNLGLNFALVPSFGFRAAAAATTVSYAVLLALMAWVSRRFFRWAFPLGSLARVGVASTIMGAGVYVIADVVDSSPLISLVIGVLLGVLLYVAALLLLGEIQPNEKRVLKQLAAQHLPGRLIPANWKQTL